MRTESSRSRMRRMRSSPFPLLKEMSTIAKSGRTDASRARALGTSSASPQTCRSGWVAMCMASPSRTTGWSSTMMSFTVGFASEWVLVIVCSPRHSTSCDGAAFLRRADLQDAADQAGPVLHNSKSQAVAFLGPCLLYADSVIFDAQTQAVRFGEQAQADSPWLAVPQGIGHRLLGDAKQLRGRGMVRHLHPFRAVQGYRNAGPLGRASGQVLKGGRQAPGLHVHGDQPAR